MMPAAGTWLSYMFQAASCDSSRNGEPTSSSVRTRSRGSSLPRATCFSRAASPPPWLMVSTFSRRSATMRGHRGGVGLKLGRCAGSSWSGSGSSCDESQRNAVEICSSACSVVLCAVELSRQTLLCRLRREPSVPPAAGSRPSPPAACADLLGEHQPPVRGLQEAFADGMIEQRQQRRIVALDVEQAAGLLVQAELRPGERSRRTPRTCRSRRAGR